MMINCYSPFGYFTSLKGTKQIKSIKSIQIGEFFSLFFFFFFLPSSLFDNHSRFATCNIMSAFRIKNMEKRKILNYGNLQMGPLINKYS